MEHLHNKHMEKRMSETSTFGTAHERKYISMLMYLFIRMEAM